MAQYQGTDYTPQMTAARISQVESQMTQIEKSLAEIMGVVDALQARLQGVMREDAPSRLNPVGVDQKDPEVLVPLASALQDKRRQIDMLSARLTGILNRVEL